ncbi:cAMP-dependent protein kinase subunit [Mactra antiquata]
MFDCVFAIGAFGGRLDHQFANFESLFTASQFENSIPVYLISSETIACLLQKGFHILQVNSGMEGKYCGLVPLSGRCESVTTTGLKWNLDHQAMGFGELISTSNSLTDEQTVTIDTDNALLWTMGVKLS